MSNAAHPPGPDASRRLPPVTALVLGICFATVVADGYDVVVFGAVVPSLLAESAWGLTPERVGLLGSAALVGMFVGSLVIGSLADVLGRRRTLIGCLLWFSVFTGLCAVAPSPEAFAALRFVAGLGLGGVLPTASALTAEYSPAHSRNLVFSVMFSGFAVGGILAALVGLVVIPAGGWRPMFLVGLLPLVVLLPVVVKLLPESMTYLVGRGRTVEAQAIADRWGLEVPVPRVDAPAGGSGALASLTTLVSRRYLAATLCFWVASFVCLFMIYGLNTWLPQIMRGAGFSLGSALSFLLVYNVGAIVGMVLLSTVADRFSTRATIVGTFLLAAVSVTLLSFGLPTAALYLVAALGGAGALGSQAFVNAYVSKHYPVSMGATALGWSLGVGRLGSILAAPVLGLVIGSGLGLGWNFYAIAIPGLLGAVAIALVPREHAGDRTAPSGQAKAGVVPASTSPSAP